MKEQSIEIKETLENLDTLINETISIVDKLFGTGFSKSNPQILASYLQSTISLRNAIVLEYQIHNVTDIANILKVACRVSESELHHL